MRELLYGEDGRIGRRVCEESLIGIDMRCFCILPLATGQEYDESILHSVLVVSISAILTEIPTRKESCLFSKPYLPIHPSSSPLTTPAPTPISIPIPSALSNPPPLSPQLPLGADTITSYTIHLL